MSSQSTTWWMRYRAVRLLHWTVRLGHGLKRSRAMTRRPHLCEVVWTCLRGMGRLGGMGSMVVQDGESVLAEMAGVRSAHS